MIFNNTRPACHVCPEHVCLCLYCRRHTPPQRQAHTHTHTHIHTGSNSEVLPSCFQFSTPLASNSPPYELNRDIAQLSASRNLWRYIADGGKSIYLVFRLLWGLSEGGPNRGFQCLTKNISSSLLRGFSSHSVQGAKLPMSLMKHYVINTYGEVKE